MREDQPDDVLIVPTAIEAECSVLGCLLLDNRVYDRIYDLISERDFYRADHRAVWREAVRLIELNKPADAITVAQGLSIDAALAVCVSLVQHAPSPHNVVSHVELVRGKSILRSLAGAAQEIGDLAYELGIDAHEAAEKAEARILSVLDNEARDEAREPVTFKDAVFEAVDWLEAERKAGIPTGYTKLDAMLSGGGMQPEQLIIIAGRPSMGKSALSYCLAEHAVRDGRTCAYFALETSRRELSVRALRWHESMLPGGRGEAIAFLSALPMVIDDSPAITLSHMRIRLRRIRRTRGLHLVVVDYLQLMRHRSENRLQEVSEISRGLKSIAKEFSVPVIAVAQLNRQTEGRVDRRPMLADLRESGQIEQDADVIMMCYRDEYYDQKSVLAGFGEVFVRKNKDGPTGEALLRWDGPRTRWIDYLGDRPAPVVQAGSVNVKEFRARGDAA